MSRALVVVEEPSREQHLLERARAFAVGEDTEIVVLALATPDEYEAVEETLAEIGRIEHTTYDVDDIGEGVFGDVADVAHDVLAPAVEYELHTAVQETGEQADAILDLATRTGCDHVFLSGRRRSPTGKAVFGDRTQRVILTFDGYVTVSMS
ncbi:universal stress protein [Natronomonas sp. EA1]|uniref:universal stress protein n=1 Tax=Natronomonas sp. EA1 TaxID=3421655 RepID=UPI003EBBE748